MTIAIASGKGGTGKTLLATNLAAWMAQSVPIVLADLDVEEPNASLFFHAKVEARNPVHHQIPVWDEARCVGCDACRDVCVFHALIKLGSEVMIFPQLCHSCYACSDLCPEHALPMHPVRMGEWILRTQDQLVIIEGRLDVGQEQAVPLIQETRKQAENIRRQLSENCSDRSNRQKTVSETDVKIRKKDAGHAAFNSHILILDAPPGTSCPVIEATREADLVLLVTEPTPFGMHDLQLAVETMRALRKPFGVVINRMGLGQTDIEGYCHRENIPVVARIADDQEIAARYAKGKLVFSKIPAFQVQLTHIEKFIGQFTEREES